MVCPVFPVIVCKYRITVPLYSDPDIRAIHLLSREDQYYTGDINHNGGGKAGQGSTDHFD
jgi:hypothetical protein